MSISLSFPRDVNISIFFENFVRDFWIQFVDTIATKTTGRRRSESTQNGNTKVQRHPWLVFYIDRAQISMLCVSENRLSPSKIHLFASPTYQDMLSNPHNLSVPLFVYIFNDQHAIRRAFISLSNWRLNEPSSWPLHIFKMLLFFSILFLHAQNFHLDRKYFQIYYFEFQFFMSWFLRIESPLKKSD